MKKNLLRNHWPIAVFVFAVLCALVVALPFKKMWTTLNAEPTGAWRNDRREYVQYQSAKTATIKEFLQVPDAPTNTTVKVAIISVERGNGLKPVERLAFFTKDADHKVGDVVELQFFHHGGVTGGHDVPFIMKKE
ncbi:MAG: hypothetical protein HZA80_02340 [Candidatus Taylorbacteria bacterium]|nr:hypothetical protein [Candidatus Taylorbacteria bacterium]